MSSRSKTARGGVQKLFGNRGFYQQYLSVMLIVLAFTIGAFLRGEPAPQSPVPPGPQAETKKIAAPRKLSEIAYQDLFKDTALNTEKLDALAEFLRNHDVRAEFELYASAGDESAAAGAIGLALARTVALSEYFERAEVPTEAVAVYSIEAAADAQARVKLFDLRSPHG